MTSEVYFIRRIGDETGLIKIGYSSLGHRSRIKQMTVGYPEGYEVLCVVSGSIELEAYFHDQFSNFRTQGEWFNPHDDILDVIAFLKRRGISALANGKDLPLTKEPPKFYSQSAMCDWLKSKYPTSTAINISADTEIPAGTAQGWFVRGISPSIPHFLSMVNTYGPTFLKVVMPVKLDWLETADKQQQLNEMDAQIAHLEQKRERLTT